MPAMTIGGALIASLQLTYSWGGSPASASIVAKGSSSLSADDPVVLTLGALSFHGKVVSDPIDVTDSEGAKYQFAVVDNRELLKEDIVTCRFNKVVILADNPATPTIDRWKRYEHIYPDDWSAQDRTWTDSPHSAEEILDYLFEAPTLNHSWTREYHDAQDGPVHEIDCNHGKSLLNAVQEVTDAQGLVFTLDGESTLRWGRKGEDDAPEPSADDCYDVSSGQSINTNATRITVVGDPDRYQELFIDLEPDWLAAWEAFWIEPLWLAEVEARFGPFADDDAGRAELAAKARTVTVQEYAVEAATPANYLDRGKFNGICRAALPAWTYLTKIVWHAYRVPRTYTVNGIALDNLTMVENMLIGVEGDLDTGEITVKEPDELYPPGAGFIMAKGQQIGIIDPRTQRTITEEQLTNAREKWAPCNEFHLDKESYVVVFDDAVFIPGADDEGLFVFPNHEVAGLDDASPLWNIVAPNAAATAAPAAVKACLIFDAELFSREYGTGRRATTEYVSGLNFHSILDEGANVREITYQDSEGAEDKAEAYADSKITNQVTYAFGGFTRKGAAGTVLNSAMDRVTVSYGTGGLSERIEYTKERGPSHFTPERELERRETEKDRYPGERKLQQEVRDLLAIAAISRAGRPPVRAYDTAAEVMATPVGCLHSAPRAVKLASAKPAGTVIWLDDDGDPADAGASFGGVVIAEGSVGRVALATQGTVPVLVKGPFIAGDAVGADDNSPPVVVVGGRRAVGVVQGAYTGSETVLVQVRLGAGGAVEECAFDLLTLDADAGTVRLRPGAVNQLVPSNWDTPLSIAATGTHYLYVHCDTDGLQVNAAVMEVATTARPPAEATMGAAPPEFDVLVALVVKVSGPPVKYTFFKVWGCGSIAASPVEHTRTDKADPPLPGQLPQDIWYAWRAVLA